MAYDVDSIETCFALVENDMGISFIPEMTASNKANRNIVKVPFPGNAEFYRTISIAVRKEDRNTPNLKMLFKILDQIGLNDH